jgi:hypothetical protein
MSSSAKREARAAGGGSAAVVRPADRTADPFPLGWRLRFSADADEGYERVPLTPADLLDPQEGDIVPEGNWHYRVLDPVADLLRRVLEQRPAAGRPALAVFRDVVMVRKGRPNLSPDVAVIAGLRRPTAPSRSVDLDQEGVRLLFALEVISTSRKEIRDKDYVGNVRIYAEAGVPEYVAVEPGDVDRGAPVKLSAWRLDRERGKLWTVQPDERGGFSSQTTGLWLGPDPWGPGLVVEDAATGQRLRFSDEEEAARREEEAARREAERRADKAERRVDELEREIARLRGRLGQDA